MEAPSELRQQLEDSNSTSVPSLSNCNGTDAGANQSLSILPGCNPPTVWETIELHFLPLMASLAEGSSDARPEMRQHSVQVGAPSQAPWCKVACGNQLMSCIHWSRFMYYCQDTLKFVHPFAGFLGML